MAGKTVAEAQAKQREDTKNAKGSTAAVASDAEAHFSVLTSLSTFPI